MFLSESGTIFENSLKIQDGRRNPRWRLKILGTDDQKIDLGHNVPTCKKLDLCPEVSLNGLFLALRTLITTSDTKRKIK